MVLGRLQVGRMQEEERYHEPPEVESGGKHGSAEGMWYAGVMANHSLLVHKKCEMIAWRPSQCYTFSKLEMYFHVFLCYLPELLESTLLLNVGGPES